MSLRVGITYNVKSEFMLKPGDPPDMNAEFDHEETINHIEKAFREAGHDVVRLGNARHLLELSGSGKVDVVFNIAEGYGGRNRESQVPILLEMLGIPYIGADGLTLGLTLDKVLTKKVLIAEGIPTPKYIEVTDTEKLMAEDLRYPLIVKLRCEGSSKGLSEKSLVQTPDELRRQVTWLRQTYKDAAIFVEEFIEGEEFTVAVIGNDHPEVYPVCQITLDGRTDLGRKFFTFAYLRTGADYICPAKIPDAQAKNMQELALRTYKAVECRDWGRVDFRTDKQGNPYVLEINPLPSLSDQDVFNFIAKTRGLTHHQIITRILETGLARLGLAARNGTATPSLTLSR
jgi:D-alanine-D-alanine ligase